MTSSVSTGEIDSEIDRIEKELHALSSRVKKDDVARKRLLAVSSDLTLALERPGETIWRIIMEVGSLIAQLILNHINELPGSRLTALP